EQGDVLVGSTIAGLSSFDISNRMADYKTMFHDGHGNFYDSYIADITEDKNGVLWMGAFEKMIRWDKKNNTVKFYKYYSSIESYGFEIRSICIDSFGRKWAGSLNNGLSLLDEQKEMFIPIPFDTSKGGAIKDLNILALCNASDGMIWGSTLKGLF